MRTRRYLGRRSALTASAMTALFAPACASNAPSETPRTNLDTTTIATAPSTTESTLTSIGPCPTTVGTGTIQTRTSATAGGPKRRSHYHVRQAGCYVVGRPLRSRFLGRLLLPDDRNSDAGLEFASVAAFAELAIRLISVGAPADLIAGCHSAALDELRHTAVTDRLESRVNVTSRAIPALRGRRVGSRLRSRRVEIARIAIESYVDGWLNESRAAAALHSKADSAKIETQDLAYREMALDEERHAALARDVVLWCAAQAPHQVGRALRPYLVAA